MSIRSLFASLLAGVAVVAAQTEDDVIRLDPFDVETSGMDADNPAGLGTLEADLNDPEFGGDLATQSIGDPDLDAASEQQMAGAFEAAAIPDPTASLLGSTSFNLRGFPTPGLRDGFPRTGMSVNLGVGGGMTILGAVVAPAGRAAPGGVRNDTSARPTARPASGVRASLDSEQGFRASADTIRTITPRVAWARWSAGWNQGRGPQDFVRREGLSLGASAVWRHTRTVGSLFNVDYQGERGRGAGRVEFREVPNGPIVGPYRPLLEFNPQGPNTGAERHTAAASWLLDVLASSDVQVRAGVFGFLRESEEDRFSSGPFVLSTGLLAGTREPLHQEAAEGGGMAGVEVTWRAYALGAAHKLRAAVSATRVERERVERGLDAAGRAALPDAVKFLDPEDPDWFRPEYSEDGYARVAADRAETSSFQSVLVDARSSWSRGRLVTAFGLRQDFVQAASTDARPGAPIPEQDAGTSEVTGFLQANYAAIPQAMLVYMGASTAFNPSTRFDSRTGELQGNETTRGIEAGVRAFLLERALSLALGGFWLENGNISRRNPLLGDPVLDADQQQPQLVAGGEERFRGGTFQCSWAFLPRWSLGANAAYTDAVTTASPDLPEEVGRALTGLSPWRVGASVRGGVPVTDTTSLSVSAQYFYVAGFTAEYGRSNRLPLAYPGYGLVGTNLGVSWRSGTYAHSANVSVSNLFDLDLERRLAQLGRGRTVSVSYALRF